MNFQTHSFSFLLQKCYSLNSDCIFLQETLLEKLSTVFENSALYFTFDKVNFSHIGDSETNKTTYCLERTFQEKVVVLEDLQNTSFNEFDNLFKIKVPNHHYFDMSEGIKMYEYLNENKGRNFIEQLINSLQKTKTILETRIFEVQTNQLKGVELIKKLGLENTSKLFYSFKRERWLSNFVFLFQIDLHSEEEPSSSQVQEFLQFLNMNFERMDDKKGIEKEKEESERKNQQEEEQKEFQRLRQIGWEVEEPIRMEKARKELLKEERKNLASNHELFMKTSSIVTENDRLQLRTWLEEQIGVVLPPKFLYSASKIGSDSADFHQNCDNQGPTLVVVKSKNGSIFGGFSNLSWISLSGWRQDDSGKSFLFSLDKKTKHLCKKTRWAIDCNPRWGPRFGSGVDLAISSRCDWNKHSYCRPSSYLLPSAEYFCGESKFQVEDYEVWKVETLEQQNSS